MEELRWRERIAVGDGSSLVNTGAGAGQGCNTAAARLLFSLLLPDPLDNLRCLASLHWISFLLLLFSIAHTIRKRWRSICTVNISSIIIKYCDHVIGFSFFFATWITNCAKLVYIRLKWPWFWRWAMYSVVACNLSTNWFETSTTRMYISWNM